MIASSLLYVPNGLQCCRGQILNLKACRAWPQERRKQFKTGAAQKRVIVDGIYPAVSGVTTFCFSDYSTLSCLGGGGGSDQYLGGGGIKFWGGHFPPPEADVIIKVQGIPKTAGGGGNEILGGGIFPLKR